LNRDYFFACFCVLAFPFTSYHLYLSPRFLRTLFTSSCGVHKTLSRCRFTWKCFQQIPECFRLWRSSILWIIVCLLQVIVSGFKKDLFPTIIPLYCIDQKKVRLNWHLSGTYGWLCFFSSKISERREKPRHFCLRN